MNLVHRILYGIFLEENTAKDGPDKLFGSCFEAYLSVSGNYTDS